uniref:Uncharacterized protein n=1 Tax=Yersinia enterocolitica TaxID=630 RepID=B0RKL7_YEREN|nr:hypothetical protein [Yersinia enterocolitica]
MTALSLWMRPCRNMSLITVDLPTPGEPAKRMLVHSCAGSNGTLLSEYRLGKCAVFNFSFTAEISSSLLPIAAPLICSSLASFLPLFLKYRNKNTATSADKNNDAMAPK